MNKKVRDLYFKFRKENDSVRASTAFAWAKDALKRRPKIEWEEGHRGFPIASFKHKGFDIKIRISPDEMPDTSWLGEFTDTWEPGAIVLFADRDQEPRGTSRAKIERAKRQGRRNFRGTSGTPYQHNDYRFFIPGNSFESHREGLFNMGYSRGEAGRLAAEYTHRDQKMLFEGLTLYNIDVTASRAGHELGSDSLGGNADQNEKDFENTIFSHGMIENAINEAKKEQKRLCEELCPERKGGTTTKKRKAR